MVYNPQEALENNKYTMGPTRTLGVHPSLSLDMGSKELIFTDPFFYSVQYRYGSYGVCLMRGKKFNPKKSPTSPVVDLRSWWTPWDPNPSERSNKKTQIISLNIPFHPFRYFHISNVGYSVQNLIWSSWYWATFLAANKWVSACFSRMWVSPRKLQEAGS